MRGMVGLRWGTVVATSGERPGAIELDVEIDGVTEAAIAYPDLVGQVAPGDRVLLNVTAVELGLGTGGVHFVVAVDAEPRSSRPVGRVMKARYTPLQTAVRSVEETHARELDAAGGLGGTSVVCLPLHSMIGPTAAGAKAARAGRVAYVMTDGAALAGAFSRLVPRLRERGLIDAFITTGQAFGGELEAVTIWSGLLAAKEIARADVVIVADGPGNLGTETRFGVSALRSGEALNAAGSLGARPIAGLRVSFADTRERHRGLSHHSRTILERICLVPATVVVPRLDGEHRDEVWGALRSLQLVAPISIVEEDGEPALELLRNREIEIRSMGRGPEQDPAFFLAAGAAGIVAGRTALDGQPDR
jgi:uncharacterized protein DUF3866